MMLLTGHSGIDLNASVNELPCFRKLRIELTENETFQAVRFTFPDSRFYRQVVRVKKVLTMSAAQ
jgi:hypothetical protein